MAGDEHGTPPSFAPGGGGSRPPASDAVPVGHDEPSAQPRRATPSRPAAPRRSSSSAGGSATSGSAAPPSIAPRSTTGRATSSSGRPTTARPEAARRPAPRTPATGGATTGTPDATGAPRRRHRVRTTFIVLALLLVLVLAWPIGLVVWANGKLQRTDALSGAAGTPGTTYLITGSDSRADGGVKDDGTAGQRSDTILLLHVPESGPTALISLPRDTYVEIPGHDANKINAAFAFGGAPLLVETVEGLTGLTVDHYAEIGMAGVKDVVDAVGGVELCYEHDVDDRDSKLRWTAGCHVADGTTALQFSRMRKADPLGDIGRAERQRQLVKAVLGKVDPKELALHPGRQVDLVDAATAALTVDESASIVDLGRLALAFRAANGPSGVTGTPPIASLDYRPGGVGSTVQLDPEKAPKFFQQLREGTLTPGSTVGGID